MRDAFPAPMERMTASLAEWAWMSRNSNAVASSGNREGETLDQEVPLLVVRRTVPAVPETQTVLSEMGERPRNWRVLFVEERVQVKFAGLGGLGCADVVVVEARRAVKRHANRGVIMFNIQEHLHDQYIWGWGRKEILDRIVIEVRQTLHG